MSISQKNFCR
uniref:Uncharacterized protein n=1 Tax=Romanomermis culicivorax TaxID=13658 RepID=A0A915HKE3_ROMCU